MMGWYGTGMGWPWWLLMGLFWLALVALVVWLVVRLATPSSPPQGSPRDQGPPAATPPESPLNILDRRFASGEIDVETYRAQRAALLEARGHRP